ncbi:hypothetical protein GQ457_11G021770 [Hibiscus cannabinus]
MSLQDPEYRYPRVSTSTLGGVPIPKGGVSVPCAFTAQLLVYFAGEYRYPMHQKGSNDWKKSPTAPNNTQRSPTARYTIGTIKQAFKHQVKANASLYNISMVKNCLWG